MIKIRGIDLKPYTELIHKLYWEDGMTFEEISKKLGISSQAGLYRHMKKYDKVKTREQRLNELKEKNKNRTFTEEQRKRVSEGVKRSYNDELRKRRSEDNKRVWKNMSAEEKKKRYINGLNKMHKRKLKTILILEIENNKDGLNIIIKG